MAAEADVAIEMIVGPEYVTGSSRMKSGTGQKMILNMISTSVMIQPVRTPCLRASRKAPITYGVVPEAAMPITVSFSLIWCSTSSSQPRFSSSSAPSTGLRRAVSPPAISPIIQLGDIPKVGWISEYVTGSSRMKSGTGQKMILNMISTSVMIQLGRVKGNKMVNMQLSNHKLVERGTRMIMEELGLNHDHAQKLLLLHGSVKNAIDAYRYSQDH